MMNLVRDDGVNVSNFSLLCEFRMIKKEILLQPCFRVGKRCKEAQEKGEGKEWEYTVYVVVVELSDGWKWFELELTA